MVFTNNVAVRSGIRSLSIFRWTKMCCETVIPQNVLCNCCWRCFQNFVFNVVIELFIACIEFVRFPILFFPFSCNKTGVNQPCLCCTCTWLPPYYFSHSYFCFLFNVIFDKYTFYLLAFSKYLRTASTFIGCGLFAFASESTLRSKPVYCQPVKNY
jgi:hypothetical protein